MKRGRIGMIVLLTATCSIGCKKETSPERGMIGAYRSYDLNTYAVEALPQGGYVLQCLAPEAHRLEGAQVLGPDGDRLQWIDYTSLPRIVEGVEYPADDEQGINILDIAPWTNDTYILLGYGRRFVGSDQSIDLLVYHVDANGGEVAPPFRRELTESGYLSDVLELGSFFQCRVMSVRLSQGGLAVAALYFEATSGHLKIMRFPMDDVGITETVVENTITNLDMLGLFQHTEQPGDHVLLAFTQNGLDRLKVADLDMAEGQTSTPTGYIDMYGGLLPYAMGEANGSFIISGSQTNTQAEYELKPFVCSFSDFSATALEEDLHLLDVAQAQGPAQSYGAAWWQGNWAMLINDYPLGKVIPFFPGDLESDLRLAILSTTDGNMLYQKDLVLGQGIRGIGLFNAGDHLVCIGTQLAYDNEEVHHTIFMKITPGN